MLDGIHERFFQRKANAEHVPRRETAVFHHAHNPLLDLAAMSRFAGKHYVEFISV